MLGVFRKNRISFPLFGCWLFGCYILGGNVYGGSIFSCLTADIPLSVPKTLGELLHSDLSIVTTRSVTFDYTQFYSMLKEFIIPASIFWLGSESPHSKLLLKLQEKSVFIPGHHFMDYIKLIKNINASQPLSYLNNSVPTQNTFALVDDVTHFNFILEPVKILGQRYIVDNRDDSSITAIKCVLSVKNFLSSTIHQDITQLAEAGISTKWESLKETNYLLNIMRNTTNDKTTIPEYLAKLLFKPRDPIVFSENQPVSMKVMKFIMILCTILLVGAGGLALLLEITISGQMWIFLKKLNFSIILLFYKCRRNLSKLTQWMSFVLCKPSAYWKKSQAINNRS
jgi:hypothetical protein